MTTFRTGGDSPSWEWLYVLVPSVIRRACMVEVRSTDVLRMEKTKERSLADAGRDPEIVDS